MIDSLDDKLMQCKEKPIRFLSDRACIYQNSRLTLVCHMKLTCLHPLQLNSCVRIFAECPETDKFYNPRHLFMLAWRKPVESRKTM